MNENTTPTPLPKQLPHSASDFFVPAPNPSAPVGEAPEAKETSEESPATPNLP